MIEPGGLGRILIWAGLVIALVGVVLLLGDRIPWLGRLPGDILIRRKNVSFYFPLATSILLSVLLSLILWLINRK